MVTLYSLYYSRRVQSKLNKRKTVGHWREKSRHKLFQRPLPGELQRRYLIPPATNCDNMCEGWSTRETRLSLGVKGFCWGLVTKCLCDCNYWCSRPPRKKASVEHISLHKLSRQARAVSGFKWAKPSYQNIPRAWFLGAHKEPVRTMGTFGECARFETHEIPFWGGIKVDFIATSSNSWIMFWCHKFSSLKQHKFIIW